MLWSTAALLLSFIALAHLGVMACFLSTPKGLPWAVPVAFGGASALVYGLGRRRHAWGRSYLWSVGLALAVIVLATVISAAVFDLSWDGQWYHQAAVYRMSLGWNPLLAPLGEFPEHNVLWIRHYAKGPWYGAVAMKALTGSHESGKFATWVALATVLTSATAAALDMGIRRAAAFALGAVAALNPVVISQVLSYLVDGLTVCYLACYTAALLSFFRRGGNSLVLGAGVAAAICSINSKFTGLIFLCIIATGAGVYGVVKARRRLCPMIQWHLAALGLGVVVWGYNPYVTNAIHRGQPFYPLLGTQEYPSLAAQGNDVLELYETPRNMMGRPRLIRLAYAVFGRPSFAPYNNEREAEFMWPFAARPADLDVYRFHDTRIAGLGPWFSGILILSLLLAGWVLATVKSHRLFLCASHVVIVTSLLVSTHLWWARYGPQLWWLPLLPIAVAFVASRNRYQRRLAWSLLGLLWLNALMVGAVRIHWDIASSHTLRRQLVTLKDEGVPIEVRTGYFNVTVGQRFRDWGIEFQEARRIPSEGSHELMSVARGNPGAVRYRYRD